MSHHRIGPSAAAAFGAGVVVAVQGRINGELGDIAGDGVLAAAINFSVGLVLLSIYVAVRRPARLALANLPSLLRSRQLPWWVMVGGLGGALYVSAQGVTVAALGVALFTVATVAGQTGLGLVVDRYRLGPGASVAITGLRVSAAVLATVAVGLAATGRDSSTSSGAWAFLLLALVAGGAVAFQSAFNGRVSVATGQPTVAALVNFVVGLTALLATLLFTHTVGGKSWPHLPLTPDHLWLYCGGAIGLVYVVVAAASVRALGVLLFSLVVLAGTLLGAVAVDIVAPTEGAQLTWNLVVGIAMTMGAVALAVGRPRSRVAA